METVKTRSTAVRSKKKLARTFQKVISLRNATKIASSNGICILTSQAKVKGDSPFNDGNKSHCLDKTEEARARHRAVREALVAKLFACVTSIKAAYAEMQLAQNPYNSDAIQVADQAVVDELKAISELKRSFLKKELDLSPQVTLMLAEIQEQQSVMRTYEITIKKLEAESETKDSRISSLKNKLVDLISVNKSTEKKLNSSGPLFMFDNLRLSTLNPGHFVLLFHHALKSIRSFVKLMIREMESARWDLDAAVKFIEPDVQFAKPSHRCFVFESFVCKTMFDGISSPNFAVQTESPPLDKNQRELCFENFKTIKSTNWKTLLSQNPGAALSKFIRAKYVQLVHAKMECSLFGNLSQRKAANAGGVPDSPFFAAFAEMSKRIFLLHSLAFSLHDQVSIFQVRNNCRFSEVFMESVTEETLFSSSADESIVVSDPELRVAFTVVPGFKIGKTVIQSQVYLQLR